MLERIQYISVFVSDQDPGAGLLHERPRLREAGRGPDTRRTAVPDRRRQGSGLRASSLARDTREAQPVDGRIPAAYTIETGDCRKAFEELESRGVKFETEVLEYPWGYIAVFHDPDGNRLQLREAASRDSPSATPANRAGTPGAPSLALPPCATSECQVEERSFPCKADSRFSSKR